MKLLFVEDEETVRENYRDFLNLHFSMVEEASNGEEALEKYEHLSPDVILIDIHIPKLNGLEVIKQIRKYNKDVNIIIMSAHKKEDYLFDAIELNITKYLVKPVKSTALKEAITKALINIKEKDCIFLKNGFKWCQNRKKLFDNNVEVLLTKKEILLFSQYCTPLKPHFTPEDLFYTLYSDMENFNINKIKMILKRLRKKTTIDILVNIYGFGYKFNL